LISKKENHNIKMIIIPGNPGLIDFYILFINNLFELLEKKIAIYGIGHAGHGAAKKNLNKLFSLEDQINHKIDFLIQYFDKNTKFILCGHSIGSYIALKIFQRRKDLQIIKVINLFPTFRYLWNGLTPFKKIIIQPIIRNIIASLLHYTPWFFKRLILFQKENIDESHYLVLEKNIDYFIILNCLYMAYLESQQILEIDNEIESVIKNNIEKLIFLYGPKDKYAPLEYYEHLKKNFPNIKAYLVDEYIEHAFVIKHSKDVANIVYSWIV
jgi:pimeloyl-ACP methyl ester carboxylesterase